MLKWHIYAAPEGLHVDIPQPTILPWIATEVTQVLLKQPSLFYSDQHYRSICITMFADTGPCSALHCLQYEKTGRAW